MRFASLISMLLLAGGLAFAHEAKVTGEGESQEFATAQAMRRVPKGASVTETFAGAKTLQCLPATGAPSLTSISDGKTLPDKASSDWNPHWIVLRPWRTCGVQ